MAPNQQIMWFFAVQNKQKCNLSRICREDIRLCHLIVLVLFQLRGRLAALLGADSPWESLLSQTAKFRTDSDGEQTRITSPFTKLGSKKKNSFPAPTRITPPESILTAPHLAPPQESTKLKNAPSCPVQSPPESILTYSPPCSENQGAGAKNQGVELHRTG